MAKQLANQHNFFFNSNTLTYSKEHCHSVTVDNDENVFAAKGQEIEEPQEEMKKEESFEDIK